MTAPRAPLLIVGSHRSGTTMLVELLEKFGYFSGWKKDGHHEATFFIRTNEWILSQAGGSWIFPEPIRYFLESEIATGMTEEFLVSLLRSPRRFEYTGWKLFWKYHSPLDFDFPWGWKTPPSTFTLPLWRRIFPKAKVIHILRHGIDVAASHKAFPDAVNHPVSIRSNYRKKRWYYLLRGRKDGGFVANLRCSSFEGSFSLWEEYAAEARRQVARLGTQAVEVQFEDFLARPAEILRRLLEFADIPCTDEKVREVCQGIDASRSFAFREDPQLAALAETYRSRLARFGYGPQ